MQTPPETIEELLREILRFHYTGLKRVKKYPKVETCCVWCLNWTRTIEENIASRLFMVTVQRSDVADVMVYLASLFPTHCFAFDREQIPESTKNLHIHQFFLPKKIIYLSSEPKTVRTITTNGTHMTSKHVEEEIKSSSSPSSLGKYA